MSGNKIIAVGLLTQGDLERLGGNLTLAWPVHDAPCFEDLLQAIGEAERRLGPKKPTGGDHHYDAPT